MKKYKRILSLLMIFILLFPNLNVAVKAADADGEMIDIKSDWQGSVFGDVGGQDKITAENFEIIENEDDTVTLRSSGNRGKISSSSDGIAYYFKQVSDDANFEITATAVVETFDANNQVSFGIMLRDDVHTNVHGIEYGTGDYVAVGALDQKMNAFTRLAGAQTKVDFDNSITAPTSGEIYELSIKKSGHLVTVKIGNEVKVIEDFTGDIHYAGLFTARNTEVTFSNVNLDIEGKVDLGDWDFNVFGDNTNDERNPDPIINENGSVTIEANGGKISSSVDGISFYHKEIPVDANFEVSTKATVHKFGANNQVSFGVMLRDEIGDHRSSAGHEANYVAVGSLDQSIKGFYKDGSQTKLDVFDNVIPSDGSEYDLSIKKSGKTYVLSINGEVYETITLENLFNDEIFVGVYVARDTSVTFSDTEVEVDSRAVSELVVDSSKMEKEYLQGEELDLTGLEVTAVFSDGTKQDLSADDYIVTGFNSSALGKNTITINYNAKTATVDVEIVPLTVTGLEIKYYPAKTDYYIGDKFDPQGLVVIAEYNDGYETAELTDDLFQFEIEGKNVEESYIFGSSGTKEVVVNSIETPGETTSFSVTVYNAELLGLEIKDEPEVMLYFIGDELDLDGMSVYAKYSDGKEVRLMPEEYEVTGFDSDQAGEKVLTIKHKNQEVALIVNVKVKEVQGIEVTAYPKTTYQVGEAFDQTGLVISKVYDNEDREALEQGDYELNIDDFNHTKAGTYEVKVIPGDANLRTIIFQVTVREQTEVEWKQIRFGQSTSTANNYFEKLDDDVIRLVAQGGSAGKVTGDHDGITFYYTEIDAEADNFVLSADIFVKEYAKMPHDGQESFGIMARDALGPADDSGVFASNIAAVGGFSGGTREENGTQLFARTGVLSPDGEGSLGIQKMMLDSIRPDADHTSENYRLTLAKTNSGFTGQINNGKESIIYEPDILKVQDGKMYVGFYVARLATIEVSNIDLTVTNAATDAPREYPAAEAVTPQLDILSLDKTSHEDYTLLVKSNVDGVVSVKQGQEFIVEERVVKAGQEVAIPASITNNTNTNFSIVFLPDNTQYLTDYNRIAQNFTVTMKTYAGDGDIYVSPEGTSNGDGTKDNPLDLDTAIEFVQEGQKIIVQEGHYVRNSSLEIKKYNDGTKDAMKYIMADPDAETRPLIDFDKKSEGVVHSGHYWHVEGIDFARSAGNTKGYTVGGSHNIIENVRTFEHGDTGLQISRTDIYEDDYSKWPSHNLILNSISFDNRDPSDNNADGFAAKLTSGDGNIFRGTVAYNNIDDGWDLYTKVGTGAIGAVVIEDSIAFNNGSMSNGDEGSGDKNGFKLGGEGVHVPHVIKNSLAFGNGTYGFTSNSNPGVIAEDNISINNGTNLGFTTYSGIETDFTIDGFVSIGNENTSRDSYPSELASDINYLFDGMKSSNKSRQEISAEHSDDMIELLEEMFEYDSEGKILSVKSGQWEDLWETYDQVIAPKDIKIDRENLEEYIDEDNNINISNVRITAIDAALISELNDDYSILISQNDVSLMLPIDIIKKALTKDSKDITITIENVTEQYEGSLSNVYDFSIKIDGKKLEFDSLTLTFTVNPNKAVNWDNLVLRYFDDEGNETDYTIDPASIDKDTGEIKVEVTHFSSYGIFELEDDNDDDSNGDGSGDDGSNGDGSDGDDSNGDGSDDDDSNGDGPGDDDSNSDGSDGDDSSGNGTEDDSSGDDGSDESDTDVDVIVDNDEEPTISGEGEKGKELSKTATSIYNMLAIGALIMLIGSILFFAQRRSTKTTH